MEISYKPFLGLTAKKGIQENNTTFEQFGKMGVNMNTIPIGKNSDETKPLDIDRKDGGFKTLG